MANAVKRKYNEVVSSQGELRQVYLETTADQVIYDNTTSGIAATEAQSAIDLLAADMPTSTSDLTNDGDGSSPFATEDYVDENGGKIDKIKVNNVEQTITDKTVNITNVAKTDGANTFTGEQTLNDTLYLAQRGSNPRSRFMAGSFLFYNNNAATTSQYCFGLYQWDDVFQFTYRKSSDGTFTGESFRIAGSNGLVTFKTTPKVNSTNVALASDVKNNTITITQGGVTKGTFTLNQGSNKTIALDGSPTKTSDLTNDSGFITSADIPSIPSKTSDLTNDSGFITESDIPDIPTKTSDLTNDSGFITSAAIPTNHLTKVENTNVSVLGTTKNTTTIGTNQLFAPNGIIFGGTATAAGLVTRGICGVTEPTSTGSCSKNNLYLNCDGSDNSYKSNRQIILMANAAGTHYGNNLYQYAAARGDAVKGWVEAKGYITSASLPKTASDTDYTNYIGAI